MTDLKMRHVYVHDSNEGRWLRWMDAICFPEYEAFDFDGAEWLLVERPHRLGQKNFTVGYCGWRMLTEGIGELLRAGVLPDWRGEGIQKYMIGYRESLMKRKGAKIALTTTAQDNFRSMNNLIACGYLTCKSHDWPMVDALEGSVFWKKVL